MPVPVKKINYFITSDHFPSISVTGSNCSLMCQHCRGKLLESLVHATTCDELVEKSLFLHKKGAKGILLTGGCDERGRVPVSDIAPAIKTIKDRTGMLLIAHTGFISGEEASALKGSGLDGIGFDVIGDMGTAKEVYGLSLSERDYIQSLQAIEDSGLMVFPHVCVGLHFGELRGEFHALEMIRDVKPVTVIITGLMPVAGTPMAHIKPRISDFEKVITRAVEMFPGTPIVLGCAHSSGKDREEIEKIALKCGVSGIAAPTMGIIGIAEKEGYEINYYGACCGIVPDEKIRISRIC
ncbi:MAG: radical SAM protein [Candidatus Methanoperedens sp.]|nr:radical SAM protein [Candidatus Methanoperedens sp.]